MGGGGQSKGQVEEDKCRQCGYDHHTSGRCPASGKKCYKYGGRDHFGFAKACPGKKPSRAAKPIKDQSTKKSTTKKKNKKGTVCYLIQRGGNSDSDSDEDEEECT